MAPRTITLNDLESLADRLIARGNSRLLNDQSGLQSDLLLAGKLLTRWCRDGTYFACPFDLED